MGWDMVLLSSLIVGHFGQFSSKMWEWPYHITLAQKGTLLSRNIKVVKIKCLTFSDFLTMRYVQRNVCKIQFCCYKHVSKTIGEKKKARQALLLGFFQNVNPSILKLPWYWADHGLIRVQWVANWSSWQGWQYPLYFIIHIYQWVCLCVVHSLQWGMGEK